jgi:hypothetical protein
MTRYAIPARSRGAAERRKETLLIVGDLCMLSKGTHTAIRGTASPKRTTAAPYD